jgi:hypothetical protein
MDFDVVGFINRFERGTRMTRLATCFFAGCTAQTFWFWFGITVL